MGWLPSVLLLVSLAAFGAGAVALLRRRAEARVARRRALADADAGTAARPEDGAPGAAGAPGAEAGFRHVVAAVGEGVTRGRTSRTLAEQLARAGWHDPAAPALFLGFKVVLLLAGLVVLGLPLAAAPLPVATKLPLVACGAGLLFFLPNVVLGMRRTRRRREVAIHLPDAIDMLEICVSSGMGLEAAWTAVSDEIRRVSTVFADEMELATLEMSLGVPRATAMRHMADRTDVQDLSTLVAMLVQAERFGAGIAESLRTSAQSLRENRSMRAEESAEKLAVKLLFPMVVFIFPALLVVMVGPAVIQLVAALSGG